MELPTVDGTIQEPNRRSRRGRHRRKDTAPSSPTENGSLISKEVHNKKEDQHFEINKKQIYQVLVVRS
jgi:hypothetical protein